MGLELNHENELSGTQEHQVGFKTPAMVSSDMHAKPIHMTVVLKSPDSSPWLLLKRLIWD
jgi:hypothetical protein